VDKKLKDTAREFRETLKSLAHTHLSTNDEIQRASSATGIKPNALKSMIYRGEGGLDTWMSLLIYIYDLTPQQISSALLEIKKVLKSKKKMTKGETLWSKVGEELNEDKLHFWTGIIEFIEKARPGYSIKKR
jgi:hypothetical protein